MLINNNVLLNVLMIFILLNTFKFVKFVNAEPVEQKEVKVSIIIPSYNTGEYVGRCIEHALNQTLKEIEVIVINDGSEDNTEEILKKYTKDKRFKYVSVYPNQGPSIARNFGMEMSTGEFIGFIDSDDYVDFKFFEYLYKLSEGQDIVVGIYVNSTNGSDKFLKHSKGDNYGCVGDTIWRKSYIDSHHLKFNATVHRAEDLEFRRMVYETKPRRLDAPDKGIYYYYKRRPNSIMNYSPSYIDDMTKDANKSKDYKSAKENKNVNDILSEIETEHKLKCILLVVAFIVILIILIYYYKHKKDRVIKDCNEHNGLLNEERDEDVDTKEIKVQLEE